MVFGDGLKLDSSKVDMVLNWFHAESPEHGLLIGFWGVCFVWCGVLGWAFIGSSIQTFLND